MPKDEFDFEDPLELNGVALLSEKDTTAEMAECFAEEFMRMGYSHEQVLGLFHNRNFMGPHMVLLNKGEAFVRTIVSETFARWGRVIEWQSAEGSLNDSNPPTNIIPFAHSAGEEQQIELNTAATDPLGNLVPELKI